MVAQMVAKKAGAVMRQYFDGDQQIEIKEDGSPVTIADKLINTLVIKELTKAFPGDGLIGEEESTTSYGRGRKWFCDPIDGTKAFTWGTPTSMFSLGLIIDGQPVMGVVYDPFLDRLYTALKGGGSFCNGRHLHVSKVSLKRGMVAVLSDARKISRGIKHIQELDRRGVTLVTFSGAVYKAVLVATGRLVTYVDAGVNAHDMAAVHLIVEEAGGKVTNIGGSRLDYTQPFRGALISNGIAHEEMMQIMS